MRLSTLYAISYLYRTTRASVVRTAYNDMSTRAMSQPDTAPEAAVSLPPFLFWDPSN